MNLLRLWALRVRGESAPWRDGRALQAGAKMPGRAGVAATRWRSLLRYSQHRGCQPAQHRAIADGAACGLRVCRTLCRRRPGLGPGATLYIKLEICRDAAA